MSLRDDLNWATKIYQERADAIDADQNGATEGRRNGINGGAPLAGSRPFMPDSLHP
jgi:hypothetical protein